MYICMYVCMYVCMCIYIKYVIYSDQHKLGVPPGCVLLFNLSLLLWNLGPCIQRVSPMAWERELWTHPCAGGTVYSGGTITVHATLANPTSAAAGTGVSGKL